MSKDLMSSDSKSRIFQFFYGHGNGTCYRSDMLWVYGQIVNITILVVSQLRTYHEMMETIYDV